ncbi:hypothetical protein TRVL_08180 [Trypanosoma vivax]|nr:hypothetical protein TRVL_08180 [Trypanosoma vivax]
MRTDEHALIGRSHCVKRQRYLHCEGLHVPYSDSECMDAESPRSILPEEAQVPPPRTSMEKRRQRNRRPSKCSTCTCGAALSPSPTVGKSNLFPWLVLTFRFQ